MIRSQVWAGLGLGAFCLAQFLTADRGGDFWWFDSPSHALNGVFLWDLLRRGGIAAPLGFALNYFAHFPGLTIGFYPPGFALWLVPFYALLGVGQAAAQLAVTVASLALAWGVMALARRGGLGPGQAFAAGLLSVAFPEMLVWGRQIQPELPAYACAVWSLWCLLGWLEEPRPRRLVACLALLLASLYVKQTTAFLVLPAALAAFRAAGWTLLRRPGLWPALLAAAIAALPLAALSLAFGGMNLAQAGSAPGPADPLFYLKVLPAQTGWAPLALATAGLVLALRRGGALTPAARSLILAWLGIGLLFFSAIMLKSPRFSTAVLPAVAILAVLPFGLLPRWREGAAAGFAIGAAVLGLATTPERTCTGFVEAAHRAAQLSPEGSTILLLARRSAGFVFDLRADEARPDLFVLRAEKLYAHYRVGQEFGVQDLGAPAERIRADLARNNVATLVIERGFWHDLPSFAALEDSLAGAPFERVASVPVIDSEAPDKPAVLDIYRVTDYAPRPRPPLELAFPLIGRRFVVPAE